MAILSTWGGDKMEVAPQTDTPEGRGLTKDKRFPLVSYYKRECLSMRNSSKMKRNKHIFLPLLKEIKERVLVAGRLGEQKKRSRGGTEE